MLNFAPTEEQEEIRQLAQSVSLEQLRAQGRASEKRGDILPELMKTLTQTGLTTPFPEEYGGSGTIEAVTFTLIAEELGYGDGALAMNILGSLMGPLTVLLAGDKNQHENYVAPFCDEQKGHVQRGSLAFAERTGGYTIAEISATVHEEGTIFILNGSKRTVIHGEQSSPRVVLARLEGTNGSEGLCAVMVPLDIAGARVRQDVEKLGLIAAPSAGYTFENAAISTTCMLGKAGNSGVIRAAALYNILRAAVACGTARAALDYASDYAKGRIAFGRPIVSYQGIAFMIAEIAMKLDAARLLVWRAASSWDQSAVGADLSRPAPMYRPLVQEAEAAQNQAIKIAKSATIDAIQILGGAGFIQDHPAEMWMRNAAAME